MFSKIVRIVEYIKRFVKTCRTQSTFDDQVAVQNIAYATTVIGGFSTRDGIGTRSGLLTEEINDTREGYDIESGVGTRLGFDIENVQVKSKQNGFYTRLGNGKDVRLQAVSNRDDIETRLGMWKEKALTL